MRQVLHKLLLVSALVCAAGLVRAEAPAPSDVYRATIDADGIQRVHLVAGSYYFKPELIVVKVAVPVELIVRRESTLVPHSLVLNAPEAGIAIDEELSTEPTTVSFTPKAVGRYLFYCDKQLLFFKSHRARGMEGVLQVVE
jgi:plastocyanin domain-containing protein